MSGAGPSGSPRLRKRLGGGGAATPSNSLLRKALDPAMQSPARKKLRSTPRRDNTRQDVDPQDSSDGEEEQSSMEMARAREWVQSQMKGSQESNQATQGSGAVGADTPRTIIKKMHQNEGVKKLDRATKRVSREGSSNKTSSRSSQQHLSRAETSATYLSDRTPVLEDTTDQEGSFKAPTNNHGLVRRVKQSGVPKRVSKGRGSTGLGGVVENDISAAYSDNSMGGQTMANNGMEGVLARRSKKPRKESSNGKGGQQSNEYDSLASSVADDDSTGMVGPSQPQQPPQLQRRQRRPALRNNQPNSVQSPAADKEGQPGDVTDQLENDTISQSPPKTSRRSAGREKQGLLDKNDVRELRRNQMKRLKAAGEEFAQIQPAESEASSKSGPVVSVSGQDQDEGASVSGGMGESGGGGIANASTNNMTIAFRPNHESTRYQLDVSTGGGSTVVPQGVPPDADSEIQFGPVKNARAQITKTRLMSVVEPLHEADEDDDAVVGGDSGRHHDSFNVSVRSGGQDPEEFPDNELRSVGKDSRTSRKSGRPESTASAANRKSRQLPSQHEGNHEDHAFETVGFEAQQRIPASRDNIVSMESVDTYEAEVAKRKSTVSESRQTRKSSSLGTSKTKDLGTTTDKSNSSQYQSRLTRRSASKSKIVPEGTSRRSSRVQELRLEHDDEGSSSRLSKQSSRRQSVRTDPQGVVGSPRVGSAHLTHQGEDNVAGEEEEGGLDHQRSGVSRRSSTAHPLVSRKSSAATSYKTAVEEPMDRSGEVEAENPPEVVTVSRRRATASRVSLVVQQDPSPVKSPREEGQQMEEEEEGENEGGAGMDNEASLSSDPSQIEHPDGVGEMDEEDNGVEEPGDVDMGKEEEDQPPNPDLSIEQIDRRLLGLGIVPSQMTTRSAAVATSGVLGSKLAGKSPVVNRRRSINLKNPKKRKKPKQTCIMPPNELKHHFNRFFGAPVPPKAWGPIFRSFQNFMAKFVGSLKEVQEELNMPINQVVLPATKLLLESYQVLDESKSKLPLYNKIRALMSHEEYNLLVPNVNLAAPLPKKNQWEF